ncbi:hypothetical protein PR202_gb29089 [Eleusine coracana subsp. coracana]|uniref:Transcription repressor n=1 Tax=Eleusine coracana subsp. coracana TaxID=191504 RepID=A0AAV5FZ56_ELECO|nr:hypothetical protein QOZ80_8BG0641800 [Eleusine coracana subsp. coracana]GJN39935.1 hypothetical protein PR202_gb29089 [Eleusine coracana subsp. coracana]
MVKKQQQQLGVGGLISSLFSSSKEVLPCPSTSSSSSSLGWQWASCGQPRTLSFRQEQQFHGHDETTMKQAYKTMNSAYSVDYSCFSNSFVSVDDSFSTASGSGPMEEAQDAVIVCALRSDRLIFEPDVSSCIFKQQAASKKKPNKLMMKATSTAATVEDDDDHHASNNEDEKVVAFGGATAMSVESQNPYRDFRESMEAVVMSHGGVKDWSWLEEMLGWYLRANGKNTHGLIVGAFVDLLVSLSNTASSSSSPAANCSSSSSEDDDFSSSL